MMGAHLTLEYPHFPDLRPRFLSTRQVQSLAWQARIQLGYGDSSRLKIPLDLILSIKGATINGLVLEFRVHVLESVVDKDDTQVLGVCHYDYTKRPKTVLIFANSSIVKNWEALLRGILAHELGHGICDAPGWVIYRQNQPLPGLLDQPSQEQARTVTPDRSHLLPGKGAAQRDFSEYRANEFMGAFLVPRPLVFEPLRHRARMLGIPLVETASPATLPFGERVPEFRIHCSSRGNVAQRHLRRLLRALASDFGVSPKFMHVRLLRYGVLDEEALPCAQVRTGHRVS